MSSSLLQVLATTEYCSAKSPGQIIILPITNSQNFLMWQAVQSAHNFYIRTKMLQNTTTNVAGNIHIQHVLGILSGSECKCYWKAKNALIKASINYNNYQFTSR